LSGTGPIEGGDKQRAGSLALRALVEASGLGGGAPAVGGPVEAWLAGHPDGELPVASDAAAEAVEMLAEGWATTLFHAVAQRPLSSGELAGAGELADGEPLERTLAAMLRLGMLERRPGGRGKALHAPTDWLREGIAPLIAAARSERQSADAAPIEALDVTGAFQLAVPLLLLPAEHSGACALIVELEDGVMAGATACFEEGRPAACEPGPRAGADAYCRADAAAWFNAVIDGAGRQIETSGNHDLARTVLAALHERLFGDG